MTCCEPGTQTPGLPALPPPCTSNSCSIGVTNLDQSGGTLRHFLRTLGSAGSERLKVFIGDTAESVLRSFTDSDGNCLGTDVDFYGNPNSIGVDSCADASGNSLYVNGVRRVRNADGTVSLGTLPIAVQDMSCISGAGQCTALFPPGEAGATFGSSTDGGCGPSPEVELTNTSCYPMLVIPKITITDALLGPGVSYQIQPQIQGQFEDTFSVFGNPTGGCETVAAGNGATASGGDPAHTHEGPSHTHTVNCADGSIPYSGTIDRPPVQIEAGATFKFRSYSSIRYDRTVQGGGELNFGEVTVCLQGFSIVNPTTVAALEALTA